MSYSLGAADSWDAIVYGEPHPSTVSFLQQQVSQFSDTLTNAGRAFMEKSRQAFDFFNSSEAMRFARDAMQRVRGAFETPGIVNLWDLAQMQGASLTMQRWIMANPVVRKMYHEQRCDGYSDTYIDMAPCAIGKDHYDYRRVMDGYMQTTPEGDWKIEHYLESLTEGDRDLMHEEKIDIMLTWSAMDLVLALSQDDPTSPVGGSL